MTRTRSSIASELPIAAYNSNRSSHNDPIPSSASSTSSNSPSQTSDPSYPNPTTPLSSIRVCHIKDELNLSNAQSVALFTLMQSELEGAGLLGAMDFRTGSCEDVLRPVLTNVKRELGWLVGKGRKLDKGRLNELLRARARIVNEREKGRRRGRGGEMSEEGQRSEEEGGVDMEVGNARDKVVVDNVGGEEDEEEPEYADALEEMHVHGEKASAQNATPPPTIFVTQTAQVITPPEADAFRPSSFIVRVANSVAGAAVRPLQLTTITQRDANLTIDDLSYDIFIQSVSEQVGFDVRGRISAVMPKMFTQFAPVDCKVNVSDGNWRAVLQAWHDMWQRACHFVIEAEMVEE